VFLASGEGRFRPLAGSHPFIGQPGELETAEETKIEAICAAERTEEAVAQMKAAHPYEEVAYYVAQLQNNRTVEAGLGVLGEFEEEITLADAAEMVKEELRTDHVRVSGNLRQKIKKAGVCGGSAGELIPLAAKTGAQLFITGEVKHSAYVAGGSMALIEAGHYDTEKCFVPLMSQGLQKRLDALQYNVCVFMTETERRPYSNI
jgi:putative NIF3 family GTP cyclohydrolase 1 type 2